MELQFCTGRDSVCANREAHLPQNRTWNRHNFCSEKHKHEWNRSRIAENRFSIAIRIATYQCLAVSLGSHDSNLAILILIQNRRFGATNVLTLGSSSAPASPHARSGCAKTTWVHTSGVMRQHGANSQKVFSRVPNKFPTPPLPLNVA